VRLTWRELSTIGGARLQTPGGFIARGVSTDTRTITGGDLFVALRGGRYDGHRFLQEAARRGAVAALVSEISGQDPGIPLVLVPDTLRALGELARLYRRKFSLPVLAVAGSNGKTTTKEMIASVLGTRYRVLATEGNLNNQIGVPLTLFGLHSRHEVAVVEIGTNHPGEIRSLCEILEPTHGLVTGIGREHLEFFGSLDGVAREEGALLDYLRPIRGAVAFINADDPRLVAMTGAFRRVVSYGFRRRNLDLRGRRLRLDAEGRARFQVEARRWKKPLPIALALPGRHSAQNALAAAAVGLTFRIPGREICRSLEAFRGPHGRMEVISVGGVSIMDDTYNANPDSMLAALETLAGTAAEGKRIAVLADMRELGEAGPLEHARIGEAATRLGIGYLLTYGPLAKGISDSAGCSFVAHYDQQNMLAEYLAELVSPGDTVLVKGSRALHMNDVVTFLVERLRGSLAHRA
jgi:UDP-N-acetylmuramoyl-tripeptide--D-alanyl-D-alanine ligase